MAGVTWDADTRSTVSWAGEAASMHVAWVGMATSTRVTWATTPPAEEVDDEPSLDFSDPDNSQYLPLL